jgi:hypothetical protein
MKSLIEFDPLSANPIPILFQSGFLTIKGYDDKTKLYELGFPNENAERGFKFMLTEFT